MSNISDYIAWRGDIPFGVSAFNHIDSLVLCQILYAKLEKVVSSNIKSSQKISRIAKDYYNKGLHTQKLGALLNNNTAELLDQVGKSVRFADVKLFAFESIYDIEKEIQFAAMSALLPTGEICVVYRGTDDTLIGWKEDFNMTFLIPIPSQNYAKDYINRVCSKIKRKIFVMGHSKGGNLAVYASSFCEPSISKRIKEVYDNDGPGFPKEICERKEYIENSKRVHTIIPEASIVGILLNRISTPAYIQSSEKSAIGQHDIFTWEVKGTKILVAEKQNPSSILTENTVDLWLKEVDLDKRKKFVNELFNVLFASGATTLLDLTTDWMKSSVAIIKKLNEMDKKTKDTIYDIVKIFFKAIKINLPPIKDFLTHG